VLAELGDLDPRLDRHGTRPARQVEPGGDRLIVPAQSPQQPSPFDRDPLDGPRRVEPAREDSLPGGPFRPATDIGRSSRVPPWKARRLVGWLEGRRLLAGRDADRLNVGRGSRRRLERAGQGRVQATERLVETPSPTE